MMSFILAQFNGADNCREEIGKYYFNLYHYGVSHVPGGKKVFK